MIQKIWLYTEQKKKGIILVIWPFSVLLESGYKGYEILLTAIFRIGLCHKFRDQSSVKGLSRQLVEFQKVRAGRILTTKIRICVDRRYLYFFPDRKSTKNWTYSYALESNSVQKMVGFVTTECWKRKHRTKTVLPLVNGYFTTQCNFRGVSILPMTKNIGNPKTQIKNPSKTSSCDRFISEIGCFRLKCWFTYKPIEPYLSNSLYKSFLTMAFVIRSPIQWRPSNRKLAVCLTGNEINKA